MYGHDPPYIALYVPNSIDFGDIQDLLIDRNEALMKLNTNILGSYEEKCWYKKVSFGIQDG